MKMIFHSHSNKTHFHKKVCALVTIGLILKVRVFGTRKWPSHYFPINHDVPCLPPKILHKYCLQVLLAGL